MRDSERGDGADRGWPNESPAEAADSPRANRARRLPALRRRGHDPHVAGRLRPRARSNDGVTTP